MSEVVNVVVALAVIVFVVRWATSSSESPEEKNIRTALGFRPKNVTPDMSETISSMFPDMPKENIHYDLLRTGSVETTTNKIIERGFLESPPPAYFRAYPRAEQVQQGQAINQPARNAAPNAAAGSSTSKPAPSLISRYQLEERAKKVREEEIINAPEEAGGKAAWEATPEKREASLRERKAQMVLAARKRMLEQQKTTSESGTVSDRKTD